MGKATFLSIISFLFIFVSSIELRISDCQNVWYFVLGILNFDGDQDDTGVMEKSGWKQSNVKQR